MSAPEIITTGHSSEGLSTFIENPKYKAFSPYVGGLYGTVGDGPIDLNDNADIAAFEAHDNPGLIPKEGSVILVAEWPPGTDSMAKTHRTMSVDVGVMIGGESEPGLVFTPRTSGSNVIPMRMLTIFLLNL